MVHESASDLARLQDLLDRSYASAGSHLLSIHTPNRRMNAAQLCARLSGMRLLALATVTGDGRPIVGPVDGVFYRGAFHFGSSPDSIRFRHIRRRPQVSATHLPGEELAVTVHGRAEPLDLRAEENQGFRRALLETYVPRYGSRWEEFLDSGPVYARIDAERVFAFAMQPPEPPGFAPPLREQDAEPDPNRQFARWFDEARESGIRAPEAAAVATATLDGAPSARMVLVKQFGDGGFVFYTNYESRKGTELIINPRAALLFHWDVLGRQVRIEGEARRMGARESAAYIRTRPRGSQLSALASPQSRVVASRQALEQRVAELAARYDGAELPQPENWGGFRVLAERFEFWQHREDRLHDRLLYLRTSASAWRVERLAP
jgi:pyridoxamine 5'-phosphate oxidase